MTQGEPSPATAHSDTDPSESVAATSTAPESEASGESQSIPHSIQTPATQTPATPKPATPPAATERKIGSGPLAARGLGVAKPASPTVDPSRLASKPGAHSGQSTSGQSSSGQASSAKSPTAKPQGNKKSRSAPRPKLAGDRSGGPKPVSPVRDASSDQAPSGSLASGAPASGTSASGGSDPASPNGTSAGDGSHGNENVADAQQDGNAQTAGGDDAGSKRPPKPRRGKVAVPNLRDSLDDDLQAELDAAFSGEGEQLVASAVDTIPRKGEPIVDGARVHGVVLKIHDGNVFVALGGPDEGQVPFEQFETEPTAGEAVEVMVRGLTPDGLYQCSLPGGAIEVSDWDDLQEGAVVEATVTATNSGGLEAKVGGVAGFIPISQISEYRVEDTSEFVDQKFLCVVTEANPRRRNLVLSRRAILERERAEKKKEQLETIEPGDQIEGVVRSIKDFGAFVDLGALDGLIHISKLSWERIKHPSEVMEEGQKVMVRIDTVDKESGKIGLSYRDLLENPWDAAESDFAVGSVHSGAVTKVAPFGCFVRLAAGVEGMVHISELANHRVSNVDAFVNEGDVVEVKVLSFDRDAQKISLSIKQASKAGAPEVRQEDATPPPEVSVKPQHDGPLRGGNNRDAGGEKFGLRW